MAVDNIKTETQQQQQETVSALAGRELTKPNIAAPSEAREPAYEHDNTVTTGATDRQTEVVIANHKVAMSGDIIIEDNQLAESSEPTHELKEEVLARKEHELLLHLYSKQPPKRQVSKRSVDTDDEDTSSEGELFDDKIFSRKVRSQKIFCHKRGNNSCRAKRDRIPAKELMFETFCRRHKTPGDIVLETGNRKSVRVKFDRCAKQITRNVNRKEQTERRKLNIEKKLRKWGIKRRGVDATQNNNRAENPGKYELRHGNAPSEMRDILAFLIALQDREVTPEDYEFLLKLDDLVPKKTVSSECLEKLREDDVDVSHLHEVCGICMDAYKIGETRKILPCKHVFHKNCIEQWLQQSSTKCPLDGLEL